LDTQSKLRQLLDDTLNLQGRVSTFESETPLLGAVPELDSMGVVALITALEERFGLSVDDDEIDGAVFQTWGSFLSFVEDKLRG
jgi:acyl carrier protein